MEALGTYPRFLRPRIEEALSDTPVVLVHGPRQCGKTTLVRQIGADSGYAYLTFDNENQRAAAREDPVRFVGELPERAVLDEVQRVPELFASIKESVDADRRPGRFLLTGSANVLTVPALSDSLAGRMEILRLHPLAQAELEGGKPGFVDALFAGRPGPAAAARMGRDLARRLASGGYPAAMARASTARRGAWYRSYLETLVQRDVADLSRIRSLDVLPRLLAAVAGQTSRLLNVADLSAPFQLTRPTIREYVTLLENVFLLEELPAWHVNRLSRLVKTPKVHMGDTGLACALLAVDEESLWLDRPLLGQMLESFVYQELRRQCGWRETPVVFSHFRNKDGVEVDIVLEQGLGKTAGVEVKASATVTSSDFRGLRHLRDALGETFVAGVVLYDGDRSVPFGDRLSAVPLSALWQ